MSTQVREANGSFLAMLVSVESLFTDVAKAANEAAFRNLGHAAASIRKDAASTIERSQDASAPGEPPHTRRGQLNRAFRFDVSPDSAIVGPLFSVVGVSAAAHEFGEEYRGEDYPERPFMGPALERSTPRFLESWRGSIGE